MNNIIQQQQRAAAKVFTEMLELFNRFAVVQPVHNSDGPDGLVVHWNNTTAEERYGVLKDQYDKLMEVK